MEKGGIAGSSVPPKIEAYGGNILAILGYKMANNVDYHPFSTYI